jgi:hypothetical protein
MRGTAWPPFYRGVRGHARPRAAAAMAAWPMGLGGPGGRADAGGTERLGRAARSAQSGRVVFFSNLFLMRKQIPKYSRNCLKARKILRKSQKIQENS